MRYHAYPSKEIGDVHVRSQVGRMLKLGTGKTGYKELVLRVKYSRNTQA